MVDFDDRSRWSFFDERYHRYRNPVSDVGEEVIARHPRARDADIALTLEIAAGLSVGADVKLVRLARRTMG